MARAGIFAILSVSVLLLLFGCGSAISPSDGSGDGVQTVEVRYEVSSTASIGTFLIPDNANNTTLYFTDTAVPWSRSESEEESNFVFLTVIHNGGVETFTATILRDGEVFQTNSNTGASFVMTIEGFLDQ